MLFNQMLKIKQSGAIVIVSLFILVTYYIFDQQDLVSVTQVAAYECLHNDLNPSLCISCINRSQFHVAQQSSIFVKDQTNQFKVMAIPKQGILNCGQILQFVSYQLPMKSTKDIKFEQLGQTKQIIKLLNIQITNEPVSKYEASMQIQSLAIFQVKQNLKIQSTIFTYSSQDSQILARYYGKIIAQSSILFAIFCLIYDKFQQTQIKTGFFGVIGISSMILGETILSNSQYLLSYSLSLTVGFYLTKCLVPRLLATTVILISLLIDMFLPMFYSQLLVVVLASYILVGKNKGFKRVGTFGIYCFVSLIICVGFREHHHWLSLPLRKIIQYANLTLAPLLMQIASNAGSEHVYKQLPSGLGAPGTSTGITLHGFEQQQQQQYSDEEQQQQQEQQT